MVPERIPGTLTASSSSPMDSCGRDPICRPSEPRFLSPKASFTDHECGGDVAPQYKLHYPNEAAIRKVGQKRGSRRRLTISSKRTSGKPEGQLSGYRARSGLLLSGP